MNNLNIDELEKLHVEKFGVEPVIVGRLWGDPSLLEGALKKAIESDKPYDETEDLTDEEKEGLENGLFVF